MLFVSIDSGIEYQHNQDALPLAGILLRSSSNRPDDLRPLVPSLLEAIDSLVSGQVVHVGPA